MIMMYYQHLLLRNGADTNMTEVANHSRPCVI